MGEAYERGWPDHYPEQHRTADSEQRQQVEQLKAWWKESKRKRFRPSCIGFEIFLDKKRDRDKVGLSDANE